MANLALLAAAAGHAVVGEHAAAEHAEPMAFGFVTPGMWVAAAMAVLIGIMIWKKVPGLITSGLDGKIAEIRKQLDEAKALRAEAEALRKEYADKIANAEKDAAAMLAHAKGEADAIIAKAEADTTAVIGRREQMASDKISAAERSAVAELRAGVRAATGVPPTGARVPPAGTRVPPAAADLPDGALPTADPLGSRW